MAVGLPERVASSELAPLLRQAFYPDETLSWMLIEALIASTILLAAVFVYGRAAWRRWGENLLWEYWKRRQAWRAVSWPPWFRPAAKPARKAPVLQMEEVPKPVPAAAEIEVTPPPKPASQDGLPVAGPPGKPKEAFVWDESKGIE